MHKAVDAVEAAILRIPKHQPPAALADDEFLRNIAVSKRQRLGKPNAITVRKFACAKHKVRSAAGAPVERVLVVGRAEQFKDRGGAVGLRTEEHTSETQSLMRISTAVF